MARREIIHGVMGAHKRGQLRASDGAPVKERRRAVAIALSMAQRAGERERSPSAAVSKLLADLKADNPVLATRIHRAREQLSLPLMDPQEPPAIASTATQADTTREDHQGSDRGA